MILAADLRLKAQQNSRPIICLPGPPRLSARNSGKRWKDMLRPQKILDDLVSPSDSCGTQQGDRYSAQRFREPLHSSRTTSRTMVRDERTTLSRAQPQEARNCRHPTTIPAHNQSLKTCRRNGGLINFTA